MTSPRFKNDYVEDWATLSRAVKASVGNRCVRCHHLFDATGKPLPCDDHCDPYRGRTSLVRGVDVAVISESLYQQWHSPAVPGLNYGVHHLDGDKSNNRWWNLLPTCNSCHLSVQARVIPDRPWLLEHTAWFKPYVAGFYAFYYGRLEITREEAEREVDRFLSMGQPWLYAAQAAV